MNLTTFNSEFDDVTVKTMYKVYAETTDKLNDKRSVNRLVQHNFVAIFSLQ